MADEQKPVINSLDDYLAYLASDKFPVGYKIKFGSTTYVKNEEGKFVAEE